MSHHCSTLILHCIDFRLGTAIKKYMEENNLLGDCDIVSAAGAAKDLASPASESDRAFILRQIDISKRLHHTSKTILMNHTDCGAYGGRSVFASKEAEDAKHEEEMASAENLIKEKYPDMQVEKVLADISETGEITFRKI
ncbi:MAG: carbonic anhydrase [Candidatus Liptonbacteria bacterium]